MYADEIHRKKLTCTFDVMCQPVNPGGVACYGFTIQEKKNNRIYKIYEEGGIAFETFSKK